MRRVARVDGGLRSVQRYTDGARAVLVRGGRDGEWAQGRTSGRRSDDAREER